MSETETPQEQESSVVELPSIQETAPKKKEVNYIKVFNDILSYNTSKVFFGFAIFFAIAAGAMPLCMNLFLGNMTNVMGTDSNFMDSFLPVIYKMIGFACAMVVVIAINFVLRSTVNPRYMRDLRLGLYKSYLEQDISYFDDVPTGVMVNNMTDDITLIHEILVDKFLTAVQSIAQSVAGLVLAFCYVWQVAFIGLAVVVVCGLIYYFGEKIVSKIWDEYNEATAIAATKAEEVLTSFRTIKSFDCEEKEAQEYHKDLLNIDKVFKKTSIAQGIKDSSISLIMNCMQAGLLYYTSYFIERKGHEIGDVFIILMSLAFATLGVSSALALSDDFKKSLVSAEEILKVLEMKPEVDRKQGNEMATCKGKIEFRDVCFKYKHSDGYAVKHLNLTIEPGQTVAFVGESGCGKSTTLQLIQRFYEIESGQILLDGVDMRTLSPTYIRSQISIVPQSPVLFSMSIEDNIKYMKPEGATEREVAAAATVGNAHDFIMELPDNYHSIVQQTSLSGGQKQRICISRAIFANTPILLLDEATAALDTESERYVQQSLEEFRHGKTAIMVAHRLATVMNADKIFVFSEGHVVEEGNHQELLDKGGMYADLVKFQLQ